MNGHFEKGAGTRTENHAHSVHVGAERSWTRSRFCSFKVREFQVGYDRVAFLSENPLSFRNQFPLKEIYCLIIVTRTNSQVEEPPRG